MERSRCARERVLAFVASSLLVAAGGGCASDGSAPVETGFRGGAHTVQMVSTVVGGKNVYIPSTVVVTAGAGRKLSIFNTTEKAHGFAIHALGVETILVPGQENVIELPELEGGTVHRIHCHLHPAHRGATLVVLPGA